MPSLSFDKIQSQRQRLIEEQNLKAQNACKKIDHNLQILLASIPPELLNENIGYLLKKTDGDLNVAIYEQQLKIAHQTQKQPSIQYSQGYQPFEKNLKGNIEQSPPKIENNKKIIKYIKKK